MFRRALKIIATLSKNVFQQFIEIEGFFKACALAYGTLISIVPFMVLSVVFLFAFPNFAPYVKKFQNYLFSHLVPSSVETIQGYVEQFANNAINLSASGIVFLLFTMVLLIFSMETVLNVIWEVKVRRKGFSAFLMYWAVLTLMPPLGGVAFGASMFLFSNRYFHNILMILSFMLPLTLSWGGFLFVYKLLPNCKVKFRDAAAGAFVAACLFEGMKVLFRIYVTYFASDTIVYGVMSAIPVLLTWLYLTWIIVILGAIVSRQVYLLTEHQKDIPVPSK